MKRRSAVPMRMLLCCGLLGPAAGATFAFTVNITAANPKAAYLQVGVGTFTGGNYNAGGTPGNNTTVNKVSVTVPAGAVGNSVAQAMTTDSTASVSFYDGFTFCNAPAQLYIGGFYRNTATTGGATVVATVPASLSNGAGNTIPFSQITWTSSGIGDTGAQPFPAGTFVAGGTQTVGTIARNQWAESCWAFSYLNTALPAAGTFTGRVVFTLTTP
ncbi:MAG: hypothetical protein U1F41_06750 [Burkholderiales bacterium]